MMMGIGTPSKKSKIERIVIFPQSLWNLQLPGISRTRLEKLYVIAFPTSDGSGITRAKRTNEKGNKYPK
jgi:hypothetical protein